MLTDLSNTNPLIYYCWWFQGQTGSYTFQLCPWFRGRYTGVLSFQGEDEDRIIPKSDSDSEQDDDEYVENRKMASPDSVESSDTNKYRYCGSTILL